VNYRDTSLLGKRTPVGPYLRPLPRVLRGCWWGGRFVMGELPLYARLTHTSPHQQIITGGISFNISFVCTVGHIGI
jgi:hypothetical protein